jgi:hypothetical protein
VDLTRIVLPRHPEDDLPFGLADPLDDLHLGQFGVAAHDGPQRPEHLGHRLVELDLSTVALHDLVEDRLELGVEHLVVVGRHARRT